MDIFTALNEKIEYSYSVLKNHQETCGRLFFVGEGKDQYIECDKCRMRVKNGGGRAIFELKGYNIELS